MEEERKRATKLQEKMDKLNTIKETALTDRLMEAYRDSPNEALRAQALRYFEKRVFGVKFLENVCEKKPKKQPLAF